MLDVRASRELQAAILGMRAARRELRSDINREARKQIKPLWIDALAARADHPMDRPVILKGAGVTIGASRVAFRAATSNKNLSGGFWPGGDWHAVEFGTRNRTVDIVRSDGTRYRAVIGRGLPNRYSEGRVAFDAASAVGTKLVAIWVTTIVEGFSAFAEVEPA